MDFLTVLLANFAHVAALAHIADQGDALAVRSGVAFSGISKVWPTDPVSWSNAATESPIRGSR